MDQKRIQYLHDNYLNNNLRAHELIEWKAYLENSDANEMIKDLMDDYWQFIETLETPGLESENSDEILKNILSVKKHNKKGAFKWIGIAAALLLVSFIGGYYFMNRNSLIKNEQTAGNDINPGKVAATLTLSNGKKIYIADVKSGNVAEESGVKITKNENGELVYTIMDNQEETGKMQMLTTYRGETQALVLPDGSKVWLNAASSLKYPSSFSAATNRQVELTGEAYFEVAKDKSHPFKVVSARQEVEVLGTHFNINAYNDEAQIKTTLLEGSVRVSAIGTPAKILKPGEQSALSGANVLSVSDVDVDDVIAWKEGFFAFEDEPVQDVMKQLARWYNVEVEYSNEELRYKKFSGSISRYEKVSQVLDKLGKIKLVSFRLENRKIIVENKTK